MVFMLNIYEYMNIWMVIVMMNGILFIDMMAIINVDGI